jgi:hypothetical protein
MRAVLLPSLLGVLAAVVILAMIVGAGRALGREPAIPWTCDDTRFVDTVPVGRGVVGPSVGAAPGCGGQGG